MATAIGVRGMRRGTGVDLARPRRALLDAEPPRRALLDLKPFIAILPPDRCLLVLSLQRDPALSQAKRLHRCRATTWRRRPAKAHGLAPQVPVPPDTPPTPDPTLP